MKLILKIHASLYQQLLDPDVRRQFEREQSYLCGGRVTVEEMQAGARRWKRNGKALTEREVVGATCLVSG